jgi:hypothetical protein
MADFNDFLTDNDYFNIVSQGIYEETYARTLDFEKSELAVQSFQEEYRIKSKK